MFSFTLYKREMKNSWKMLVIFAAILTLYVSVIIKMYDPELAKTLDQFVEVMPEIMNAVGMSAGATTLIGFICSYLYGMLLLIFPMVFLIIRSNGLIAKYVDRGYMVTLLTAPVKRRTVAFTQMKVLGTCLFILLAYITILQLALAHTLFPGELDTGTLLLMNVGLYCLELFIGGICFLSSCIFSDEKHSLAFGAGIPIFMYVMQMVANMGGEMEKAKYFTFFSLYQPEAIIAGETNAYIGMAVLAVGGIVFFVTALEVFARKDLHI